ncbi:MAG: magnesium chelatase ATPase subunit I [Methylobacterium sp.]
MSALKISPDPSSNTGYGLAEPMEELAPRFRPVSRPRRRTPEPQAEASKGRALYPFSALVGQEAMKTALLLTTVDPTIGGVLIFGDRGTGKSTAIRALAALLPPMRAVAGCPYSCEPGRPADSCEHCRGLRPGKSLDASVEIAVPVVDLPLGATEDRVVGALDLEKALARGEKAFQPGLLAKAHRGYLYIDEVNLLEDHLVDVLLDVAASGENVVEREGLSIRHPARFVLIGSGNPEEGELRPQLLDRFGLSLDVVTPTDLETRIEVIRRRDAFDRDPQGFCARWKPKDVALRRRIAAARRRLPMLAVSEQALRRATELCLALGTDGLRGELTLIRAARAMAAWQGATSVEGEHVKAVGVMALQHRLRRNPLDEARAAVRVERAIEEVFGQEKNGQEKAWQEKTGQEKAES